MGKSKKHEKKSKSKHKRKEKKKKSKKQLKSKKSDNKEKERKIGEKVTVIPSDANQSSDFSIPVELMNSKSHAPETPEEYQKRMNRIRRDIDPVTGRSRLVKGDGEILEEIVSKERHKTINKEATKGDGYYFQENALFKR